MHPPSTAKAKAVAAMQTLIVQTSFCRSTLSARAPAGSVNRKKGRDATVDINEIKKGDPVKIFIIQIAALSCAATQVPEITAAIQSFLNAGFRSAAQVEFVVMIGDEGLHPLQRRRVRSFRNFIPKHAFTSYCSKRPILRETHRMVRVRGGVSVPAEIDEEVIALCNALVASKGG